MKLFLNESVELILNQATRKTMKQTLTYSLRYIWNTVKNFNINYLEFDTTGSILLSDWRTLKRKKKVS